MRTRLFEWAAREGISTERLAAMLGYSERHMYRLKARPDDVPETLAARAVLRLGDWARTLFLPAVSVGNVHNDSNDCQQTA
ncbi:MAG: hypothetical protein BWY76_02492 [bacterium ADurb.Bin429]|nr:MAG: hypothetical protein BWY76_02492 [bacterium ADurb.Bin429]